MAARDDQTTKRQKVSHLRHNCAIHDAAGIDAASWIWPILKKRAGCVFQWSGSRRRPLIAR